MKAMTDKGKERECDRNRLTKSVMTAVIGIGCMVGLGVSAHAQVEIDINQSGANVVASGSGAVDTNGLTFNMSGTNGPSVDGNYGFLLFTPDTVDLLTGISGPSEFGTGNQFFASSYSGNLIGLNANAGALIVPDGYISGTETSGEMTWDNTTLAGLGLTSGSYEWSWGADYDQTLTVIISAVPEPSTYALFGLGALALVIAYRRRVA